MALEVLKHPLVQHLVNHLRCRETNPEGFRRYCEQITTLLAVEATRDLHLRKTTIETPLETMEAAFVADAVVVVAILRAGAGMIESVVRLLPEVSVGYIGLERDEETAKARHYYRKFPVLEGRRVMLVDPMLATGGSAEQALEAIFAAGADTVDFLCIVAAPEGVQRLESRFPQLRIFAGALDRELDENKYIRPGLGDFGDRLYGT